MLTPGMETFAGWVLLLCVIIWVLTDRLAAALCWLDRRNAETDAQTAADHDEPTREQVEWELHIAEAIRLTKADAEADRRFAELEFAASVLADIDDLPGGGDAA